MKKILLSLAFGVAFLTTGLISSVYAYYGQYNYQYPSTYNNQNTAYIIKQISPCLSYKYNNYGQVIETINTCNNYNYSNNYSSNYYQSCTQLQTYPYINNCGSGNYYGNNNYSYSNSSSPYYTYQYSNNGVWSPGTSSYYNPSYSGCDYYYYDAYGNYTCGSYNNTNMYYPYTNNNSTYTSSYTPTNYYPYYGNTQQNGGCYYDMSGYMVCY